MKRFDSKTLDYILESMVETVGSSKDEIFRIGEQCRQDFGLFTGQLAGVRKMLAELKREEVRLEDQVEEARIRLSEVSLHFKDYAEVEIREAYEQAHQLQMALTMNRQLEEQLRERGDDLRVRLQGLQETVEKSEQLSSQVSVVMNYLDSDLKQMGQLLKSAQLKEDFGFRIIEAQEEERKRLSREIHDGPAQMLANVMVRSDLIEWTFRERGTDEALAEVRSQKEMVRSALQEVRRIIYDLRPMALDDLGLVPTLKKYLQTIEQYHKAIKIDFFNLGEEVRLPTKYEVGLFRLVQESVQNALKHSGARTIKVTLMITDTDVTVTVKDDGSGFDAHMEREQSFGMIGMKERVDLLDGKLTIDSVIGSGTDIWIKVPL